jgi:mannose-6-phosphate isomerase-like protein (cupin superfamily)
MKITDPAKGMPAPNPPHVDVRKIYESLRAMAVVITLRSGEALKKHITPADAVFYIIEGSGVVEIGYEKQTAGKDMLMESPVRIPRRRINESPSVFPVPAVKAPKLAKRDKIALIR